MYCPRCGYEDRETVRECPDCRVPLVSGRPPSAGPLREVELVRVLTTSDVHQAVAACALLKEAGVRYLCPGWSSLDRPVIVGHPLRIQVVRDRVVEARRALSELKEEDR